jgi:hypothetical protein
MRKDNLGVVVMAREVRGEGKQRETCVAVGVDSWLSMQKEHSCIVSLHDCSCRSKKKRKARLVWMSTNTGTE